MKRARYYLICLLLSGIYGCAASAPRFKSEADSLYNRLRMQEVASLFPVEFQDVQSTLHRAEEFQQHKNVEDADRYFQFAVGKMRLLESRYFDELTRREEAVRCERERQERLAAEEARRQEERARVEAAAKAEAARKLEEEKAEARKRAERARAEREAAHVPTHTIKRGETLPQIAALPEVYGDASLWPLLYRANRDQISNPAVLWPGQVLRIPRNYDKNDLAEARKFSSERRLR